MVWTDDARSWTNTTPLVMAMKEWVDQEYERRPPDCHDRTGAEREDTAAVPLTLLKEGKEKNMNQFKTTSLADQVFEKLENDIIQGVYPRGEILTELKLVDQLGVSRTPIREALRRLEQERLIEDTGKGSRVVGITEEDLEDIMNIRQRIEGLAAYYATKNMTPEGLAAADPHRRPAGFLL